MNFDTLSAKELVDEFFIEVADLCSEYLDDHSRYEELRAELLRRLGE